MTGSHQDRKGSRAEVTLRQTGFMCDRKEEEHSVGLVLLSLIRNWSLKFSNRVEHWVSNAARNWAQIWLVACFFAFSTIFSAHHLSQEAHMPGYKGRCRRHLCNRWVYKEMFPACLFCWWHICNHKQAQVELDLFRGLIQLTRRTLYPWEPTCPFAQIHFSFELW